MKSLVTLSATAGALLCAATAPAAFLGVEVFSFDEYFANDHPSMNVRNAWAAMGDGQLDVYRVYAMFNAPNEVLGVYGEDSNNEPMYLSNLTTGVFWNYTEVAKGNTIHFDTAPNSSQFANPATASHAFDTFATVGLGQNDSATAFAPFGFQEDMNHFQTDWTTDNALGGGGDWYVTGFPAQGVATQTSVGLPNDGIYRVLLFQFTVAEGDQVEGQFGVAQRSGPTLHYGDHTYFRVPSPGGFGLLFIGAMARRRRSRLV